MRDLPGLRDVSVALSGAALLSFLGRSLLDYGYVFPELNITMPEMLPVTLVVLLFYGGWLWGLVAAARGSRRGLGVTLIYNALLVLFGVSTFTTLCPSPCPTAWPLGELLMWSNVLIGTLASVVTFWQIIQFRQNSVPMGRRAADEETSRS